MAQSTYVRKPDKDEPRPARGDYDHLRGQPVRLNPSHDVGPFKPCGKCGATAGVIRAGMSTHPGRLQCGGCGRHLTWLGKSHMDALNALLGGKPNKGGR